MAGEAREIFIPAFRDAAPERVVGCTLDDGVQMGPVIMSQSRSRIQGIISQGIQEEAEIVLDGCEITIPGNEKGNFLSPTIVRNVPPEGEAATTEIFGTVMATHDVNNLDEAIDLVNMRQYGNGACRLPAAVVPRTDSVMKPKPGRLVLILGWRLQWHFSPSAVGKTVLLAPFTGRATTRLSFSPRPKWL